MGVQFLSDEWASAMTEALNKDEAFTKAAAGQNAKIQQIVITPEGDKKYYFDLQDGKATVAVGELDSPDAALSQDYDTAVALAKNEIGATAAYMSGKLKLVSGDLMKLMALQGIFNTLPGVIATVDVEY